MPPQNDPIKAQLTWSASIAGSLEMFEPFVHILFNLFLMVEENSNCKKKKNKSLELHEPNWIPANDRCQRNTFIWRWTCPSYTSLFVKLTLQCLTVGSAKVTFTQLSFLTLRLLIITTNQRTYLLFKSMDEYQMSLSCQASGKAGVLWLDEFPWLYVP